MRLKISAANAMAVIMIDETRHSWASASDGNTNAHPAQWIPPKARAIADVTETAW